MLGNGPYGSHFLLLNRGIVADTLRDWFHATENERVS